MRKKFSDFVAEDGEGGVPANNAGGGNIAGIGVGPKGEPGIDPKKKRKQFGEDGVTMTTEDSHILKSFAVAGQATATREAKRAAVLDAKPFGFAVTLGRKGEFIKTDVGGATFWIGQRQTFSSRQMALELGTSLTKYGWLEEATDAEIEAAAKAVHDQWMDKQKELGHDEHKSPDGSEDYMVPFHKLSDDAKELDRNAVKAVIDTLGEDIDQDRYVIKQTKDGWRWYDTKDLSVGGEWRRTKREAKLDLDDYLQTHKDNIREEHDTFAGARVFEVDMDRVMGSRFGKHPRHRYSKYVGEDETGEAIRQHGRDRKSGDIILKDATTAVMTYLRRKPAKM